MSFEFRITRATVAEAKKLAPLFDLYRQFYRCNSNIDEALAFLTERLANDQSVIFIASNSEGSICGFTQLYPSFTSLGMARVWILNDLYVVESLRRAGVGRMLMLAAEEFACSTGARSITLETQVSNTHAQALYKNLGYDPEAGFMVYSKQLRRGA
jgi:ribosomal protein S18 acetylase RimI-like enzyme